MVLSAAAGLPVMTAPHSSSPDIVELVTDELLAHGEFSSMGNNRSNAREAARAVIDIMRATPTAAGGDAVAGEAKTLREAFEVWAASDNRVIQPLEFEERTDDNNHYYESDYDNNAFIGWKAARSPDAAATPSELVAWIKATYLMWLKGDLDPAHMNRGQEFFRVPAQAATPSGPVAWRSRHKGSSYWKYVEEEPDGPSVHLFDVEPLFNGVAQGSLATVQIAADEVVSRVCEWDDRTSPEGFPEALLITPTELHRELMRFAEDIGALLVPSTDRGGK